MAASHPCSWCLVHLYLMSEICHLVFVTRNLAPGVLCTWYLESDNLSTRGELALVTLPPGTWHLGTWNMAVWHLSTWQLGVSWQWSPCLAFPLAAACTCLIAANCQAFCSIMKQNARNAAHHVVRHCTRISLHRLFALRCEHQLCALASFVLVQQCTI